MRKLIILLNICAAITFARAQSTELGLMLGGSLYSGDLYQSELAVTFEDIHPAGGVFGRFNLNHVLSARVGVSMGTISGMQDTFTMMIRPGFRSNILELALTGEISPVTIGSGDFMVKPYLFGGAAIFRFDPETQFDGDWIKLQPLGTEGQGLPGYEAPYNLTQISIPFGGGVKFIINDAWSIGLEFGFRRTFTDHLDDLSSMTVNYLDVYNGNGSLAAKFSNMLISGPENGDVDYQRGGPNDDWYHIGGLTISYFLGGSSGMDGSSRSFLGGRKRGKAMGCPTF